MTALNAEFRVAFAKEIREGYDAYESGAATEYPDDSDELKAWLYGVEWAYERAAKEAGEFEGRKAKQVIDGYQPTPKGGTDFDTRGQDYETQLVGRITDTIIDADRLARLEHRNGFPNFAMYRLVLAGDRAYLPSVRQWWVLFSIEWCRNHMRGAYSEELATIAAWDSLQRTMDPPRPILAAPEVADSLGVQCKDYVRVRDNLAAILSAALRVYWDWMNVTYRVVRRTERNS